MSTHTHTHTFITLSEFHRRTLAEPLKAEAVDVNFVSHMAGRAKLELSTYLAPRQWQAVERREARTRKAARKTA